MNKWKTSAALLGVALVVFCIVMLSIKDFDGIDFVKDFIKDTSMIKYLILALLTVVLIGIAMLIIFKSGKKDDKRFSPTMKMTIVGTFTALSYVLMFFGIPFILPFLKIEFSIVIVVAVMLLVDYKSAILVAFLKSAIDYMIKGSAVGYPIDQMAHFIAVFVFITTIYICLKVLKKPENENKKMILGFSAGVLATASVMVMLNFLWILPVYIKLFTVEGFYSFVEMDEPKNFFLWVLSIFGTFNLIQWGLTAIVSFIIYKKAVVPLKQYIEK